MELKGKVAVVTGASSGIGFATAKALAQEGCKLALIARDPKHLLEAAEVIKSLGVEAIAVPTDIRASVETESMAQKVLEKFGTMDILVNSAFWGPPGSIEQTTEDFWDMTLDTTLKGAYLCVRAFFPTFKKNHTGRVVNIGSKAGKIGEDNRTAYCAAKWGLEGLNAALAVELGKYDVRVHLISPAATYTPFWTNQLGDKLKQENIDRMIPPDIIARTVVFVLSMPDAVHIPDVPVYNYENPFKGKGSPFES